MPKKRPVNWEISMNGSNRCGVGLRLRYPLKTDLGTSPPTAQLAACSLQLAASDPERTYEDSPGQGKIYTIVASLASGLPGISP